MGVRRCVSEVGLALATSGSGCDPGQCGLVRGVCCISAWGCQCSEWLSLVAGIWLNGVGVAIAASVHLVSRNDAVALGLPVGELEVGLTGPETMALTLAGTLLLLTGMALSLAVVCRDKTCAWLATSSLVLLVYGGLAWWDIGFGALATDSALGAAGIAMLSVLFHAAAMLLVGELYQTRQCFAATHRWWIGLVALLVLFALIGTSMPAGEDGLHALIRSIMLPVSAFLALCMGVMLWRAGHVGAGFHLPAVGVFAGATTIEHLPHAGWMAAVDGSDRVLILAWLALAVHVLVVSWRTHERVRWMPVAKEHPAAGSLDAQGSDRPPRIEAGAVGVSPQQASPDEHRRRFLSALNHELRAPLATLLGYCALLRGDLKGQAGLRGDLYVIERCGRQLLHLLDEALAWERGEQRAAVAQPQAVEIRRFLAEVAEVGVWFAKRSDGRFEWHVAPEVPYWVCLDASRLRAVLLQCVLNAWSHGKCRCVGLSVSLDLLQDETLPRLVMKVYDDGGGFDPEHLPRLTEPYFRGMTSGGLGLGLAFCKRLSEAMEADFQLENTSKGVANVIISLVLQVPVDTITTDHVMEEPRPARKLDDPGAAPAEPLTQRDLNTLRLGMLEHYVDSGRISDIADWVSTHSGREDLSAAALSLVVEVDVANERLDLHKLKRLIAQARGEP